MRQSRMDTDLETMDLDQGGEVGVRTLSKAVVGGRKLICLASSLCISVFPAVRHWLQGRFWTWRTWFLPKGATSWPTNAVSFQMDPSGASAKATKRCTCLL